MSDVEQGSIGGGWLGTYLYKGLLAGKPPVRFEATFSAGSREGKFTGTILDDGELGEADITGEQQGRNVSFTKVYRRSGHQRVFYEGALSEDSRMMQGRWQIAGHAHGVWDARRIWSHSATGDQVVKAQEQEETHPRERVGAHR